METLYRFVRHLRLQFQLVLAPVFLLGYLLGGGHPDGRLVLLFVLVHVGIYGGMTAYNSFYDRDEGPIGGMKHPPKTGAAEHWGGLGIQALAVGLLAVDEVRVGAVALVLVCLGVAYSHPRVRLKAHPWGSLLTVSIGQGVLPFFMGVWAASGPPRAHGEVLGLAAAATAALITGLYPLTQVYQIEEDRRRGDRTFAVHFGPGPVFGLALGLMGGGLALLGAAIYRSASLHGFWLALLPLAWGGFGVGLWRWKRRFASLDVYANHDWAFRLSMAASGAFWVFVLVEMAL